MCDYDQLIEDYKVLTDENINLAYDIMQRATAIKDSIGENLANAHKVETDRKHMVEVVKSKLSIKSDAKNSTNGNRQAMACDEYYDAVCEWTKARKHYEYLTVMMEVVSDIRYQAFGIWSRANKELGGYG